MALPRVSTHMSIHQLDDAGIPCPTSVAALACRQGARPGRDGAHTLFSDTFSGFWCLPPCDARSARTLHLHVAAAHAPASGEQCAAPVERA
jgi:hypothetical protein